MALYPSLEDMKMDQMAKAQNQLYNQHVTAPSAPVAGGQGGNYLPYPATDPSTLPYPVMPQTGGSAMYPSLGEYLGLELSAEVIEANLPGYHQTMQVAVRPDMQAEPVNRLGNMIAPLSNQSLGLQRAIVTNGIREFTLCKDKDGKIGLRVQALNKGIIVSLVSKNSPAAMAGLRFGDQILQINGKNVAGYSMEEVHSLFKKAPVNGIAVVARDRPFERTVTLHKDSVGKIGFNFKEGKVVGLVVESSAARNGLMTEHQLLEVNGQNVVGLKDKEITQIIEEGGDVITVTIIPYFIYQHMTKSMNTSLIKSLMDHSIPSV